MKMWIFGVAALSAAMCFGATTEDGVTKERRGALGPNDMVVTDVDTTRIVAARTYTKDEIDRRIATDAPVRSVNGRTGRVILGASDVGALPNNRDDLKASANFRNAVWDVQIGGGCDTNAVDAIANSAVVTNALTVATTNRVAAHVKNTNNPHAVTAAQVGAVPLVEDYEGNKTAVTIGIRTGGVGTNSLANGGSVVASGNNSHAEGFRTTASGDYSHAEGHDSTASGDYSHAEGVSTTASGIYSHAEGYLAYTRKQDSFAFAWNGDMTRTTPYESHGSGTFNINPVGGLDGFYIGEQTLDQVITAAISVKADKSTLDAHVANTDNPHDVTAAQVCAVPLVEDVSLEMTAVTIGSRKDGELVGEYSFANGFEVTASSYRSHAEGYYTTASGGSSHAEGYYTTASGYCSHAEGYYTTADGDSSHAEGRETTASANYSHAEGIGTKASGDSSHAEGLGTTASGDSSHAEGDYTTADGDYSHAEGKDTTASGYCSHAEGLRANTKEQDSYAFAWNGDATISGWYNSHGEGTFNINPVGGLDGFYIGEQTLYAILTNKADRADISATNPTFSNAVLAVGLNIDTNSVAVLNEIAENFGGFPLGAGETATTVGGLLAALAAATAWLKKNKVGSFASVGGATATVENGVAKLDDFFTESNSLLTGIIDARLPYPLYAVPSTGLLKDRAINTTSLASVTVPDNFTDLLVRASVASSLSVTMQEATTKYGDTFPGEAGEYLITITKTGAAEAYVRTIKLEEVA